MSTELLPDEEILAEKKEFCNFIRKFADDFEETTDLNIVGLKISAFFMTLKKSIWQEIATELIPFMKKG